MADDEATTCSMLDNEMLAKLTISIAPNLAMKPGDSQDLDLGNVECCYVFNTFDIDACTHWSVEPNDKASIDPVTGMLQVSASAQAGDKLTVTADVAGGRKIVTIDVYVYTREANPLFGTWREDAEFACADDAEIKPDHVINELLFRADGTVNVTWNPFELYVDYWGTYAFDKNAGTLRIHPTGGNYVPDDIDGDGTFTIDALGALVLDEMWLGSPKAGAITGRCGHRFVR